VNPSNPRKGMFFDCFLNNLGFATCQEVYIKILTFLAQFLKRRFFVVVFFLNLIRGV
jgi:hypothetical protein